MQFLDDQRIKLLTGRPRDLESIRSDLYGDESPFKEIVEGIEGTEVKRSDRSLTVKFLTGKLLEEDDKAKYRGLPAITKLCAYLEYIFDYDHFCREGKTRTWGAYPLVVALKVDVCPYCNRHYTATLEKVSGAGRTRPQLDHFYKKSTYPYFAVSFFNLIPSCYVCNSNLKGDKQFSNETHLNPYDVEGEFGDRVRFTLTFPRTADRKKRDRDYLNAWLHDPSQYEIGLKPHLEAYRRAGKNTEERKRLAAHLRKVRNSRNVFQLRRLYNNQHKDYVSELITKSIVYSEAEVQDLMETFPDLFPERKDVMRMITSNYVAQEDLDKRVLAKLTRDIWTEFGIRLE